MAAHECEALMPGYNWDEIRARWQVPYARGLRIERGSKRWCRTWTEIAEQNFAMPPDPW